MISVFSLWSKQDTGAQLIVSQPHYLFSGYEWTTTYWSQFPQKLWTSAHLMIFRAIMLWIILLQLTNSIKGFSGAEHETLCTSNACFTLHLDKVSFVNASKSCEENGGYLMTIRDREEEDVLRTLVSQIHRHHRNTPLEIWIGLKMNKGSCVLAGKTLRGFQWVSGERESHYSNWGKEPTPTCTERCVRVGSSSLGHSDLKWTAGRCKVPFSYACKFYFKGMCKPLSLMGPGHITYTPPFSKKPLRSEMKLFPLGTYANIDCKDDQESYSVCLGGDTYHWTSPGPFCETGKRSCAISNGGCEDLCHEDADNVRCSCQEGYELNEDGLSCRIKNLCNVDTCEHLCVMGESGFFCKCPQGFQLDENLRNCSDVDECQSHVCGDDLCKNTRGSYTCVCKDGYERINGECVDVDECALSRCEHGCSNNFGSFSCHCNKGFTLSQDDHSCVDINECASSSCQFACVNTAGSFRCECPRGLFLESNGLTCSPVVTGTTIAASSDEPDEEETQENFTESLTRTTVELQHQSPHTDPPLSDLVNVTQRGLEGNKSLTTSSAHINDRVIICVLGSVIPLLALIAVTLTVAIFRCNRTKKEVKKNTTTDGYCWVSSGLDPRLEKLYESILTD